MKRKAGIVILTLTFVAQLILNTIQGMTYFQSMVATGIVVIILLLFDLGEK